jgi:hypothetical protein
VVEHGGALDDVVGCGAVERDFDGPGDADFVAVGRGSAVGVGVGVGVAVGAGTGTGAGSSEDVPLGSASGVPDVVLPADDPRSKRFTTPPMSNPTGCG